MAIYKILTIFIFNYFAVSPSIGATSYPLEVRGLIAPVFAPVNAKGKLTLGIIPAYAMYLKNKGINSISVAGYTGEGPTLSVAEMKKLTRAWVKAATPLNMKIIVFVGGRPFTDTLELATFSEKEGVDAIVALADLFYSPVSVEELVKSMELVARAAPKTPLIYYDIPRLTAVDVNMVEFTIEATERIPTFKALAIDDCEDTFRLLTVIKEDQRIIVTNSTFLAPTLYLGIDSFAFPEIGIFPDLVKKIYNEGEKGERNESNISYLELLDLTGAILSEGNDVPAFKTAMNLMTTIDVGPPRAPESPLSEDREIALEEKLKGLGQKIARPYYPNDR